MSDLLSIGSAGVGAYQRALATVSNNIANVSTDGYSRQEVSIASNQPREIGGGYMGTGARFDAVRRQFDSFVESNLRNSNSELKSQEPLLSYVNRLIDVMGGENIGLTSAMNQFFEGSRNLSNDPASTIARSSFLREADGLASRFRQLSGQLQLLDNETRQSVQTDVGQINSYTQQLAQLNKQLGKNASVDKQPSELLDQRDLLLRNLSGLTTFKTEFSANGAVLVSIGDFSSQGFLVKGEESRNLAVETAANGQININYQSPPTNPVTGLTLALPPITSGKIGGVLNFREQVLTPSASALDDLAATLAKEANAVHRNGIDAEGQLGGDLFGFSADQSGKASGFVSLIQDANRVAAAGQFRVIDDPLNGGTAQARISYVAPEYAGPTELTGQLSQAQKPFISTEMLGIGISQPYASVGLIQQGQSDVQLTLSNPSATQSFQVMTRDGRHLLGAELSATDQSLLMKSANGMENLATYNTSYLNQSGDKTYMDMDIFMGVKAAPVAIQQFNVITGALVAPTIEPAALTLTTANLQLSGPIAAGTFQLNGVDMPALASGGSHSLNELKDWFNSQTTDTKVAATLSADGTSLTLNRTTDATTGEIRLGMGANGNPADLQRLGFGTSIYIKGNASDDLLVFVTDSSNTPSAANVTAQYGNIDNDMKQALRNTPLQINFKTDTQYEIVDTATNTVLAERSLVTVPGMPPPSISYRGLQLAFSNAPKKGDHFTIDSNRDGIGNNEAMLKMVDLENAHVMPGGLTMTEGYIEHVNQVGNVARQASIAKDALTVVYDQAKQTRDGVSGVSLDQEASDLVRFQQAYQANAKVMQVASQLFDAILQLR
jgi:flagellar hook-associated protein 1